MATIEELEARRAARKSATETAKLEQYAKDLEALDKLEEEHGESAFTVMHVPAFTPGLPTLIVIKSPAGTGYFKRFQDQVGAAKGHKPAEMAAQEMLARACLAYPSDPETVKAMTSAYPNLLNAAAKAVVDLATVEAEDAKKD